MAIASWNSNCPIKSGGHNSGIERAWFEGGPMIPVHGNPYSFNCPTYLKFLDMTISSSYNLYIINYKYYNLNELIGFKK